MKVYALEVSRAESELRVKSFAKVAMMTLKVLIQRHFILTLGCDVNYLSAESSIEGI